MSLLAVYSAGPGPAANPGAAQQGPIPDLISSDAGRISQELASRGLRFERWPARVELPEGADQESILAAYAGEIRRVQGEGGYASVDAIRLTPDHPERQTLRRKFLAEHTHGEDEVRFFVEGRGLFCLHLDEEVLQLICERNDLLSVPAGTRHWFDMGAAPAFCALRFFTNPSGWVAQFTGDRIAERFPLLDDLLAASA
jgi:1,2-dihydroxy-3-keto-5-methylthiopentene dioxygenase